MNETILTAKIKVMIRKEFPGTYVQRVTDRYLSGIPDLRIICYGMSGDLEIKLPGKGKKSDASDIQAKVMEWMKAAGGTVGTARSVEEARLWMHKFWIKAKQQKEDSQ